MRLLLLGALATAAVAAPIVDWHGKHFVTGVQSKTRRRLLPSDYKNCTRTEPDGPSKPGLVKCEFNIEPWIVDYWRPTNYEHTDKAGKDVRLNPFHIPENQRAEKLLVNGQYPGPLIEAVEGDIIEINVINNLLDEGTTLHWHGLHQLGTPYSDGTIGLSQGPILPEGKNQTYRFRADPAGSHYWHSHMDAIQMARGLRGPIAIHKKVDPFAHLYKKEKVIWISDEWRDPTVCLKVEGSMPGNPVCADVDKIGINGQFGEGTDAYPYPIIDVEPDTCYRFRIVHGSSNADSITFSIAGHQLTLLALDGVDVNPIEVSDVKVHLGARADVRFCTDQAPGNYIVNATYDMACYLTKDHIKPPGFDYCDACHFWGVMRYSSCDQINCAEVKHNPKEPWIGGAPIGTAGGMTPGTVEGPSFDLDLLDNYKLTGPYGLDDYVEPYEPDVRYVMSIGDINPLTPVGKGTMAPDTSPLTTTRWYQDLDDRRQTYRVPDSPILQTKGKCGTEGAPFINVPENATVVEVVINNLSPTAHVLHMHGHWFRVINYAPYSQEWCKISNQMCFLQNYNKTKDCPHDRIDVGYREDPDEALGFYWGCRYKESEDRPKQFLKNPLRKDTLSIWRRSWMVVRFNATNPGVWAWHCHLEHHIVFGMVNAFNVKPSMQPPIPNNIPTMGDCPVWSWPNDPRWKTHPYDSGKDDGHLEFDLQTGETHHIKSANSYSDQMHNFWIKQVDLNKSVDDILEEENERLRKRVAEQEAELERLRAQEGQ